VYSTIHLVEVRLELLELTIGKTAELERVGAHRNRVSSIEATSQNSSENHASRRNTSDLEAARTARSEGELSTVERLVAHVVVVLGNSVERVHLAAVVDAAAANSATEETADNAASKVGTGTEDTIASEAFAVKTLLSVDGGGEDHGEGDEGVD
jgi:hypothetical protein